MEAYTASTRLLPSSAMLTPPFLHKLSAVKLRQAARLHRNCRQLATVQSSVVLANHVRASAVQQQVRSCMLLLCTCSVGFCLLGSPYVDPRLVVESTSGTSKQQKFVLQVHSVVKLYPESVTQRFCCLLRLLPCNFSMMRSLVLSSAYWTSLSL